MPEKFPTTRIEVGSDEEMLALHSTLQDAERLRLSGQYEKAILICERLLNRYPDYVGALQTIGLTLADNEQFEKAQTYLSRAVMLNPKDWRTLTALSGVYLHLGAAAIAMVMLEQAQKLNPDDASILATLGEIYRDEREFELAAEVHKKAYELDSSLTDALLGYGLSCVQLGRHDEAARAFEAHLKIDPEDIYTLFSLTHLPPSAVKINVLDLLRQREEKGIKTEEFQGAFAFSKVMALDKVRRYDEAWKELVGANRAIWKSHREEYAGDLETRNSFLDYVRKFPARAYTGAETAPATSLFILGPSRSGKTTLESLISGLKGVKCGHENPIIENSVRRTFQTAGLVTRDRLVELPPGLDPMFRDFYLADLKGRAGYSKVFTNTHPGRIFDVLRLASAIPQTRFLFVKRNLDDIVLRIFMKRYNSGHLYSYNIDSAREYVNWYFEMIDVCAAKLPKICRVVHYEDMIADPMSMLRIAAELCDLSLGDSLLPPIGDDRGAAAPYKNFLSQN